MWSRGLFDMISTSCNEIQSFLYHVDEFSVRFRFVLQFLLPKKNDNCEEAWTSLNQKFAWSDFVRSLELPGPMI